MKSLPLNLKLGGLQDSGVAQCVSCQRKGIDTVCVMPHVAHRGLRWGSMLRRVSWTWRSRCRWCSSSAGRLSKCMEEYLSAVAEKAVSIDEQLNAGCSDPRAFDCINSMGQELYSLGLTYGKCMKELDELEPLLSDPDPDIVAMAQEEAAQIRKKMEETAAHFQGKVRITDSIDDMDVILETQGGAGGEEGSLFAAELFEIYEKVARQNGWKWTDISDEEDEAITAHSENVKLARISGEGVMYHLKWESGVHRVQRVPQTETGGRIHTSTAGVK
eukprot:Sspe_Gene.43521::Locus_21222_Transcript_1_1_Confidence_1.000_Length_1046::g.43521::m.43521/K02835/prfA, MTRF1, MRF1; peptide chain release factor 1